MALDTVKGPSTPHTLTTSDTSPTPLTEEEQKTIYSGMMSAAQGFMGGELQRLMGRQKEQQQALAKDPFEED